MTAQEPQQRERRVRTQRGVVMIGLGVFVLLVAAVRDDNYSWQGFVLGGVGLAFGAFFLVWALRS